MPQVIILKGLPASGKSTWAKDKVSTSSGQWKRINKDDLRAMMDNSIHSPSNERMVLQVRDNLITTLLRKGYNVIVDDTNLHPKHESRIKRLVGPHVKVSTMHFDTSIEQCILRDSHRTGNAQVGEKVIRDTAKQWEEWQHMDTSVTYHEPEHVLWVDGAQHAVMCDIDGTLAHNDGHRSFYEWSKVGDDSLDQKIAGLLALYKAAGYTIILMSGRDACCREETEFWLKYHEVNWDLLYMRPVDDQRKDSIVKRELFDENVRGKYNIHFVLDDRNSVCDMWRNELNLTTFQVADGNF